MSAFELPIPVMSAELIRPPEHAGKRHPDYFVPYFQIDLDRDPERSRAIRETPHSNPRRGHHCTTCGKPGHNSRSSKCPGPEATP